MKAINEHGIEAEFSDRVWAMMPKHKNGWIEIGEALNGVKIPEKIVEYQSKLKEEKAKDETPKKKEEFPQYPLEVKVDLLDKTLIKKGLKAKKRRLPKNDSKK